LICVSPTGDSPTADAMLDAVDIIVLLEGRNARAVDATCASNSTFWSLGAVHATLCVVYILYLLEGWNARAVNAARASNATCGEIIADFDMDAIPVKFAGVVHAEAICTRSSRLLYDAERIAERMVFRELE
jgi:hypothetical protein